MSLVTPETTPLTTTSTSTSPEHSPPAAKAFTLIAAPHTPMDGQGRIAPDVIPALVDLYADSGVDGIFINGTTGEFASLTMSERLTLAQAWVSAAGDRLRVIVHVGHDAQGESVQLARHAQEIGADGIATVPPHYFHAAGVKDLVDFCVPVAAAAADLPFYYYDIPSFTHVRASMAAFLEQASERIPNLRGVKASNPDQGQLLECVFWADQHFGGGEIYFGCDEMLLSSLATGVTGAVGSTYNYLAPLYRALLAAWNAHDLPTARVMQQRSVAFVKVLAKYGYLAASKTVLSWQGVPCGPVRCPLTPLTPDAAVQLWDDLQRLTANWCESAADPVRPNHAPTAVRLWARTLQR